MVVQNTGSITPAFSSWKMLLPITEHYKISTSSKTHLLAWGFWKLQVSLRIFRPAVIILLVHGSHLVGKVVTHRSSCWATELSTGSTCTVDATAGDEIVAPKTPGLYLLDGQTRLWLDCISSCLKGGVSVSPDTIGNFREKKVILGRNE